jgi:hypothetical protein
VPKRPKRPRDPNQLAKLILEIATGEAENVKPVPPREGQRKGGLNSPAVCTGSRDQVITGDPNPDFISTSHVERSNLTIRMSIRRFTRLTNAFSKKLDNHKAALALHFMHYNFGRIHKTLRVTPAMEAGVADHVWSFAEIAQLAQSQGAARSN